MTNLFPIPPPRRKPLPVPNAVPPSQVKAYRRIAKQVRLEMPGASEAEVQAEAWERLMLQYE